MPLSTRRISALRQALVGLCLAGTALVPALASAHGGQPAYYPPHPGVVVRPPIVVRPPVYVAPPPVYAYRPYYYYGPRHRHWHHGPYRHYGPGHPGRW